MTQHGPPTPVPGTPPPGWGERAGRAMASPAGVLILVPLLVLGVGGFMAVSSQLAIRASIQSMAAARFADQTAAAAHHTASTLGQADQLLSHVREYLRAQDVTPPLQDMARVVRALMRDRDGVSHVALGTPAGDFYGVYLDDRGEYLVTERHPTPDGRVTLVDYRIPPAGPLEVIREEADCGYRVTERPFYGAALESGRRVWTDPYVFWDSGVPGVTAAEALTSTDGTLLGVIAVDFNLNALSGFIEDIDTLPDGDVFLFTAHRTLLAHPGVQLDFRRDQRGVGILVRADDVDDPRLHAFFDGMPAVEGGEGAMPFHFDAGGGRMLATVMPVPIGEDLTWYVGAFAPEAAFMAPARAHAASMLRIAVVALPVALALAALLAWTIVRSRREVARARAALRAAQKEVRELGSYRLVRKLGQGGMGEVWLGEHRMLARPAAVKLVHGSVLDGMDETETANLLARFEREARVTATLTSPNTVQLYDYGRSDDGVLFYVMELLDGLDLHELVSAHGPVGVGRAVHILRQVCSSLAEAHDRGLVHRDIKPANVFLCRKGDDLDIAKMLDFGLVQVGIRPPGAGGATRRFVAGTPAFMAPEQAMGRVDLDGRADLYSVGCLGHWLLTGRQLFQRTTVELLVQDHISTPPPAPSTLAPRPVPPALDALILACLAKEPDGRPRDARELRRALQHIPVPDGQRWDEESARAWWDRHHPAGGVERMASDATLPAREAAPPPRGGGRAQRTLRTVPRRARG